MSLQLNDNSNDSSIFSYSKIVYDIIFLVYKYIETLNFIIFLKFSEIAFFFEKIHPFFTDFVNDDTFECDICKKKNYEVHLVICTYFGICDNNLNAKPLKTRFRKHQHRFYSFSSYL